MIVRSLFILTLFTPSAAFTACRNDEIRPPTARYELRGETALDKKTRLEWQRCALGQTWSEAKGCEGEVVGLTWEEARSLETDGWRVPTRFELMSLISSSCTPALNSIVFPGMEEPFLVYWTTSKSGRKVWMVNFRTGTVRTYIGKGLLAPVRLVRGGRDRT
ncbi:MAG: DUF1566 domain-containing protein [Proteobacteria bacterium]|nr:DUF1566 domain-containing protein [Pseudomonadota bacterium]